MGQDQGGETVGSDGGPIWRERGEEAARSALDTVVGARTVWPLAGMLLPWAMGWCAWVGCTVHQGRPD
jgi:hypothetical protein